MKRVIIQLDEAEFCLTTLESVFKLTQDNMTRNKRETFQKRITYLRNRIQAAKDQSEYSYLQETLEELEDE